MLGLAPAYCVCIAELYVDCIAGLTRLPVMNNFLLGSLASLIIGSCRGLRLAICCWCSDRGATPTLDSASGCNGQQPNLFVQVSHSSSIWEPDTSTI